MYTQCPDCGTPFRVTAEVLKQAAGEVRCGGCGNAFNALAFLSETVPQLAPANDAGLAVPELQPELLPDPSQIDGSLPKSISAEQSAALLRTLDQLAGSDIRIEDTGVEWRVLDDDVAAQAAADDVDEPLVEPPANADDIDEILEAAPAPVDEIRFDDDTPLPDDFDLDDESSYEPAAPEITDDEEPEAISVEPQPDITLSDPSEWNDILGEFAELPEQLIDDAGPDDDHAVAAMEAVEEVEDIELEAVSTLAPTDTDTGDENPELADTSSHTASDILDIDTQFSLQAEALGIDLSGMHALDEADAANSEVAEVEELELDEVISDFDEGDEQLELIEEPIVAHHSIEDELAALEAAEFDDGDEAPESLLDTSDVETETRSANEHYVAPPSKSEQTINMMIDQDLMALAIEDKDGFASTIIIPEDAFVADSAAQHGDNEDDSLSEQRDNRPAAAQSASAFEAIVMEGESVQSDTDIDKRETYQAAAVESMAVITAEETPAPASKRKKHSIIGAVAALILLLLVQAVHQFRESLATMSSINGVIAPIYRALGQPLQPQWDITGWRFEATKGNTDVPVDDNTETDNEQITIYSRVGNESDAALPYPLIGISLTDRFEETIGSRILEPAEYLPEDVDPRKLVRPGENFNAVISIHTPSKDTTGFKLNVCYRMSDKKLRCAIKDFK